MKDRERVAAALQRYNDQVDSPFNNVVILHHIWSCGSGRRRCVARHADFWRAGGGGGLPPPYLGGRRLLKRRALVACGGGGAPPSMRRALALVALVGRRWRRRGGCGLLRGRRPRRTRCGSSRRRCGSRPASGERVPATCGPAPRRVTATCRWRRN